MRDKTLYRYYYLFSYPELEKLAKQAGFEVLKSFAESSYHLPVKFFSRNICLLVRKDDVPLSSPIYNYIDTPAK